MTKLEPNEAAELRANGDKLMLSGSEPQTEQEPVAWQMRQNFSGNIGWGDWAETTKENAQRILRERNYCLEVRPLYAAPSDLEITKAEIMAIGDTVTTLRKIGAAPSACREALDVPKIMEVVRSRWNFEEYEFDAIEKVLLDPECAAALSAAQSSGEVIAWTNEAQLGFLKDAAYAEIPMAMWAKRSGSADVALYAAPVASCSEPPRAWLEAKAEVDAGWPACSFEVIKSALDCQEYMPLTLKPLDDPNHDPGEHWVLDAATAYLFRIGGSRECAERIVATLNAAHAFSAGAGAGVGTPTEFDTLADEYQAGLDKCIASGYEEFNNPDFLRQRRMIIAALRAYPHSRSTDK